MVTTPDLQVDAVPHSLQGRKHSHVAQASSAPSLPAPQGATSPAPLPPGQQGVAPLPHLHFAAWLQRVVSILSACGQSAGAVALLLQLLRAHVRSVVTAGAAGSEPVTPQLLGMACTSELLLGLLRAVEET